MQISACNPDRTDLDRRLIYRETLKRFKVTLDDEGICFGRLASTRNLTCALIIRAVFSMKNNTT